MDPAARPSSWADWWGERRNRLLADRRFLRWATAFPLTRPVARRRGRALFDLCAGFVYSQILLACVRLNLFDRLAGGSRSVDDLSADLALTPEATRRLLRAAVALDLVEARGPDRYGLAAQGAALTANPGIAQMIEHHALLYDDLRDPVALLRGEAAGTAIGRLWPYAGGRSGEPLTSSDTAGYTALMSVTQRLISDEVLAVYDFRRHRLLLDIGGGDGAFLAAVARQAPEIRLVLFDLPPVAEEARRQFQAKRLDRATAIGGDFLADPLPSADAVSLIRIIHDHDDPAALVILTAARKALSTGGVLVLAEPMAEADGAGPIGDAYFGFYLLAMGSGRPRSAATLAAMAKAAGFVRVRVLRNRTPFLTSVIVATA